MPQTLPRPKEATAEKTCAQQCHAEEQGTLQQRKKEADTHSRGDSVQSRRLPRCTACPVRAATALSARYPGARYRHILVKVGAEWVPTAISLAHALQEPTPSARMLAIRFSSQHAHTRHLRDPALHPKACEKNHMHHLRSKQPSSAPVRLPPPSHLVGCLRHHNACQQALREVPVMVKQARTCCLARGQRHEGVGQLRYCLRALV